MLKKVVITGATGMIGIALVNKLVENGIECLLLVKEEFVIPNSLPDSPLCKKGECDLARINEFDYPNAANYEELAEKCHYLTKKYTDKTILTPDKLNIICGSFYMIGKMKWLKTHQE